MSLHVRYITVMPRFLVVQLARFGDLIQTKRLISELSREHGAEVHLCVDRSLETLAPLVFPDVRVIGISAHGAGVTSAGEMLLNNRGPFQKLRDMEYDRVFNLNFSGLNFALSTLFDPDQVAGYRRVNGQDLKGWWPSMAFRFARNRRWGLNLPDFWAAFHALRMNPADVNPPVRIPEHKTGEGPGGGLGVVLAGRNARRSLPPDVAAPIIAARLNRLGHGPVVLLGSKAEKRAAEELKAALTPKVRGEVTDLTGKTDWKGLMDVLSGLDEVLSPDTGTMHLAAHLGVPVTAFFLSSAWCFETGPYGAGHQVWQAMEDCAPCLESRPCDNDLACLAPFRDPGFLRALAADKYDRLPSALTGFSSEFDDLGLTFSAFAGSGPDSGSDPDPDAEPRKSFRAFLTKHLIPRAGTHLPPQPSHALKIYQERDWMCKQHV